MRKNIFTIFRKYESWKDKLKIEAQEKVIANLRESYNIFLTYNLDMATPIEAYRAIRQGQDFDAILTHLPPTGTNPHLYPKLEDNLKRPYNQSLMILDLVFERIAKPGKIIPIIVYTAAGTEVEPIFKKRGISKVIFKKNVDNWKNEAEEIKQALDSLF
jgi:hypothetical protein